MSQEESVAKCEWDVTAHGSSPPSSCPLWRAPPALHPRRLPAGAATPHGSFASRSSPQAPSSSANRASITRSTNSSRLRRGRTAVSILRLLTTAVAVVSPFEVAPSCPTTDFMSSAPTEPREPPDYQRLDAEAEGVQHEVLSVPGERQRSDQQHGNDDRDRHPPAPHREPDDPCDPFPNVHVCTSFIPGPARHPKRDDLICCHDLCAAPLDGCHRTRVRGKSAERDGKSPDGVSEKWAQLGLGPGGDLREPRRGKAIRPSADRRTKGLGKGDESF